MERGRNGEMDNGESPEETVAVVGLGYVGLVLAFLFLKKGFRVIGIDIDGGRIRKLRENRSYISDISDGETALANRTGRFEASRDFEGISGADAVVICVPTPIDARFEPDLRYLRLAGESIGPHLREGQLVVLESSTYPGTTEEVLLPLLASDRLEVGRNLFVGYSPERINPGDPGRDIERIPKIVSGVTETCRRRVIKMYGRVFETVVPVSSVRTAEMVKIVENSQRLVNISFMNELSRICRAEKISIWEVVEAAATKPYGFSAYLPGPGVGGHCIPVDPLYLKWKAAKSGVPARLIELAHEINQSMPHDVVRLVCGAMGAGPPEGHLEGPPEGLPEGLLKGKKILVLGIAYKKDVNDIRESPARPILRDLMELGADVRYHDPYIPEYSVGEVSLKSVSLSDGAGVGQYDCVLILTDHRQVDYRKIVEEAPLVVDTRNATKGIAGRSHVVLL